MPKTRPTALVPTEVIQSNIHLIHGKKVMFDKDLALLYMVRTRDLNKAVTRNLDRFPDEFMFQLSRSEFKNLMFQFGTSSWGGTRKLPRAYTEHGILMLSSVLNSKRATQVNIQIMREFVRMRKLMISNEMIKRRIQALEKKYRKHDEQFQIVFDTLKKLLEPPPQPPKKKPIGFHVQY